MSNRMSVLPERSPDDNAIGLNSSIGKHTKEPSRR